MRWLKRKICNWLGVEHFDDSEWGEAVPLRDDMMVPVNHIESTNAIHFNVHKANGGIIVQTNFYNNTRNQKTPGLYIITDEDKLGEELAKIITMETLKQ